MNCIVNNNDFPGLTGVEVAANRRPTLTTTSHPPSFCAKIYFKSMINFPFDVDLQNVQSLIVMRNEQRKEF